MSRADFTRHLSVVRAELAHHLFGELGRALLTCAAGFADAWLGVLAAMAIQRAPQAVLCDHDSVSCPLSSRLRELASGVSSGTSPGSHSLCALRRHWPCRRARRYLSRAAAGGVIGAPSQHAAPPPPGSGVHRATDAAPAPQPP